MTSQEHQLLQNQNVGDSFSGTYYVEKVFVKQTVQKKDYLDMTLRDRSGSRFVKYWGTLPGLEKGNWVFIAAVVEDYQGNPSIIAKNIEKVDEPEDLSPYISIYEGSEQFASQFDEVREELKKLEEKTGDKTAGSVVDEVYGNSKFFQKFVEAPGSVRPHYGRKGGLLANTLRVTNACKLKADLYQLSDLERSIVLASALLCRVGAIDAYFFQDCVPVETNECVLLGLNNLTMTRVSSALKRVVLAMKQKGESLNQDTVLRLLHAVSSHCSADVLPSTKEAMLLSAEFLTDKELVDAIEFMQNDANDSEDFTAFDPATRRRYYTGAA